MEISATPSANVRDPKWEILVLPMTCGYINIHSARLQTTHIYQNELCTMCMCVDFFSVTMSF